MSPVILPIPDGVDFLRAAAAPVAGNTILRTFHALPAMPAGGTLFIAGGSGPLAHSPSRLLAGEVGGSAPRLLNPITPACFRSAQKKPSTTTTRSGANRFFNGCQAESMP